MTRATFYNHYSSPLELLIQVLLVDLERAHRLEEERRAEGTYSPAQMLRLTTADVAEHIERFKALYQHAANDAADGAVYEALVRHFADYALLLLLGAPIQTYLTSTIRWSLSSSPTDSPEPSRPGSATTRSPRRT